MLIKLIVMSVNKEKNHKTLILSDNTRNQKFWLSVDKDSDISGGDEVVLNKVTK